MVQYLADDQEDYPCVFDDKSGAGTGAEAFSLPERRW
jgi:hypothetical protein